MAPLRVSTTKSEWLPDDPTAFVPTRLWKLPFITTWDDSRNQNRPTDSAEEAQFLHGAEHAVLGRAGLAAQHAAHIFDTHAFEMPQDKRGAFRRAQFGHGLAHAVADFSAHGDAVWPGFVRGESEGGIVHPGIRRGGQFVTPFARAV